MTEVYKELGKKIKNYRKDKNITTSEFAKILNISAGHLSNIENGTYDIFRLELLFKIASELGITFEELLQFKYLNLNQLMVDDYFKSLFTHTNNSRENEYYNKLLNSLVITYISTISKFKSDKDKLESITSHIIDELNLIKNIS